MSNTVIYSVNDLPVQQNRVYEDLRAAVNCPRGNLTLVHDDSTGIVHNASFRPDLIVYDEHYQNEQGHSSVFLQHLDQVAEVILRHFEGKSILEIGCGKGLFLNRLRMRGFSVIGIDPAYEGDAPYILKKHFSASLGVRGDAVILRHVLEHIPDPLNFLAAVREANGGKGFVYIEVPCLDWIAEHRAWFDIYYEHVNYFRIADFFRLFGTVKETGRFFGGQYFYVVADLSTLHFAPEKGYGGFHLPDDFLAGLDRAVAEIENGKGRKNVLWGGASKGVIFAIQLLQRGGIKPDFAIDINPAKQDMYLPVTGLPVLSPEKGLHILKEGDAIFVMNSNYFTEIQSTAGSRYTYYKVDENEF
jgi:SAM-dependent methyltransferase